VSKHDKIAPTLVNLCQMQFLIEPTKKYAIEHNEMKH